MLKSQKHVFWEALLIAIVVFVFGFLMGFAFESNRIDKLESYYASSEIFMTDGLAFSSLADLEKVDCEKLVSSNLFFADKIYEEAKLLGKYEARELLSEDLKLVHKKYDLLRTFLWMNSMKIQENCPSEDYNIVVYLYEYETEDLAKKATQQVWSKVLGDLKQDVGNRIVLIPLAADIELASLDYLVSQFEIEEYPAVVINGVLVEGGVATVDELKEYLT